MTQLLYCTPVLILKKEKGYVLIQGIDAYLGWIPEDAITSFASVEGLYSFQSCGTGLLIKEKSYLWDSPLGEKKMEILHGTRLPIGSQEGEWLQVMFPNEDS